MPRGTTLTVGGPEYRFRDWRTRLIRPPTDSRRSNERDGHIARPLLGQGILFADRGEFVAKGFEEPVRVYEVRWRE